MLVINADDWGRTPRETDIMLECHAKRAITSVSAMVFMEDSERAAVIAKREGVDAGLHINFTEAFTAKNTPDWLRQSQVRLARFLKRSKYALLLYHPFLRNDFRRVFEAQEKEYLRLYGAPPSHMDGHQHMHLCSNMLVDRIIPAGTKVRRSFSSLEGERGAFNRGYRRMVDRALSRAYRLTDYFFDIGQCLEGERLKRVLEIAKQFKVELMTHPYREREHAFLLSDDYSARLGMVKTASYASV